MIQNIALWSLLSCGDSPKETSEDTGEPTTADTSSDTEDTDSVPPEPEAFVLSISGSDNESLTFDTPTCQIPDAVPHFNLYWRLSSGGHKFVLRVFINAEYEGTGTYDNSTNNISVRLQEEAGGSGRFYQTEAEKGDVVTATIETNEEGNVWGTIEVATMHNGESSISLSPTNFPIWCTPENTN